jgi:hypothetical protein
MKTGRLFVIFITFILSCIFIIGCGKPKLESKWRNRQISIDGNFEDWQNDIAYYNENTRISIGVVNDDTYLYVCLITRNRGFMEQLMRSGFSVWFDPEGGTDKVFGIHFPFGMQGRDMPIKAENEDLVSPDEKNLKEHLDMFQDSWQQIEVIGPGKEEKYTTSIGAIEKDGISVQIGRLKGYFVYELKVPLVESEQHAYYIGVKSRIIGIGFETSITSSGMPGGMPRGGGMRMSDDNMPAGRGRGMPGGCMGGGMPNDDKGIQMWMTVILAPEGKK